MKRNIVFLILGLMVQFSAYAKPTKEEMEQHQAIFERKCERYHKDKTLEKPENFDYADCSISLAEQGNLAAIKKIANNRRFTDEYLYIDIEKQEPWFNKAVELELLSSREIAHQSYYLGREYIRHISSNKSYIEDLISEREEASKWYRNLFFKNPEIERIDGMIEVIEKMRKKNKEKVEFWYDKTISIIFNEHASAARVRHDDIVSIGFYYIRSGNSKKGLEILDNLLEIELNESIRQKEFDAKCGDFCMKYRIWGNKNFYREEWGRVSELLARLYFDGILIERDLTKSIEYATISYKPVESDIERHSNSGVFNLVSKSELNKVKEDNYIMSFDDERLKKEIELYVVKEYDMKILPLVYPVLLYMNNKDNEVEKNRAIEIVDAMCQRKGLYGSLRKEGDEIKMACDIYQKMEFDKPLDVKFNPRY